MSNKRVFIIGAGASSIYGVPLGNKYLEECLFGNEGPDHEHSKIVITHLNSLIPGGINVWKNLPFEVILSFLQKNIVLEKRVINSPSYQDISNILIDRLCKYFWHKTNNYTLKAISHKYSDADIKSGTYPYKSFIDKISSKDDVLITTNYDPLLDRAVYIKWRNIRYNENHTFIVGDKIGESSVLLLKPMGSINWYPSLNDEIELTLDDGKSVLRTAKVKDIMTKISISPPIHVFNDFPKYFELPPSIGAYPVIIPPIIGADLPDRWGHYWVGINQIIYERLVDADEVFIIGYSFPDYYEFFRILVRKALASNKKNPKLFVIDKYSNANDSTVIAIIKNYIRTYSECNETYLYGGGFDEWLNISSDWSNSFVYQSIKLI